MNRFLAFASFIGTFFGILAHEETSCNPQEIHNYLLKLHQSAEQRKIDSYKRFSSRFTLRKEIDRIENDKLDKAMEFINSAALNCAHEPSTIEALVSQIKDPSFDHCNLGFIIKPLIERINKDEDNANNIASLKSIITQLPSCPKSEQVFRFIKENINNHSRQQELDHFIQTLPKK